MKTILLLLATLFVLTTGANAQNGYSVYRATGGTHPPNGFRTVAEENALMEKTLAERRKKAEEESGLTAEERARVKQEEAEAAKKRAEEAKKRQPARAKK